MGGDPMKRRLQLHGKEKGTVSDESTDGEQSQEHREQATID